MTSVLTAWARPRWSGPPWSGPRWSSPRWAARALIGTLALLLPLATVVGCSQAREQAGTVVEHAIEEAIDGLDLTDGLPPDFPAEAVPVVDGNTRGAVKTAADGATTWVAVVDAEDSGEHARDLLTDAGLEITHTVTTDVGVLAELSGNDMTVKLIASPSRVVYVVTPAS